ncbi:succinate dehydrogenase assembly factor 2 [Methylomonas sp. LL1]|uniref:FAD assembly factor SdhE n=1 Tax=Methylomonas sp. LL1 TaxID=2785785 RepID=UPI0018C3B11A|nr:succinate dehydrogenase assembly factor 2 [Methylomonas sp. LL1]QPK64307.1 succinate dehydrogenase assembly factor 2 [Methylomonas sp. LL1]
MSELNKLRWRCRRGTLELDLMLIRYLDLCYRNADTREKQSFLALLELEDTELLRYLMGEVLPDNPLLAQQVSIIRALPAHDDFDLRP